jgi:hypothetical protein
MSRAAARLLAILCLQMAAPAWAANKLTRGPYLQLVTRNSATVVWQTHDSAACSLGIGPVGGTRRTIDGATGTTCAIAVDGLLPGTAYSYVTRAGGDLLGSEATFRTDDPGAPFSFVVIGDHGENTTSSQPAVRDRMVALHPDFIVSVGDMIYSDGAAADFDPKFFTPYASLLRRVVFWPCLGNHDVHTSGGGPWRDAFYTPANNVAGNEGYYSFDQGNAHFVVLDSNRSTSPGSSEYTFLDQDLAASDATWKFVFFHHTLYSSGTHGSATGIRDDLLPLFDEYAVDIVFMGHDHDYERTVPLRDDQEVAPGAGTIYITTGGGGASLRDMDRSDFTAYAESEFHVTHVTVNGGMLRSEMVRPDGVVRDAVVLSKGSTMPCEGPDCCQSDAECDDRRPCTIDSCLVSGSCSHAPVGLEMVRLAIAEGTNVEACTDEQVPRRISRLVVRAAALVGRAETARRPARAARFIRIAAGKLLRAARIAERAGARGDISQACADGLTAGFNGARFDCVQP